MTTDDITLTPKQNIEFAKIRGIGYLDEALLHRVCSKEHGTSRLQLLALIFMLQICSSDYRIDEMFDEDLKAYTGAESCTEKGRACIYSILDGLKDKGYIHYKRICPHYYCIDIRHDDIVREFVRTNKSRYRGRAEYDLHHLKLYLNSAVFQPGNLFFERFRRLRRESQKFQLLVMQSYKKWQFGFMMNKDTMLDRLHLKDVKNNLIDRYAADFTAVFETAKVSIFGKGWQKKLRLAEGLNLFDAVDWKDQPNTYFKYDFMNFMKASGVENGIETEYDRSSVGYYYLIKDGRRRRWRPDDHIMGRLSFVVKLAISKDMLFDQAMELIKQSLAAYGTLCGHFIHHISRCIDEYRTGMPPDPEQFNI